MSWEDRKGYYQEAAKGAKVAHDKEKDPDRKKMLKGLHEEFSSKAKGMIEPKDLDDDHFDKIVHNHGEGRETHLPPKGAANKFKSALNDGEPFSHYEHEGDHELFAHEKGEGRTVDYHMKPGVHVNFNYERHDVETQPGPDHETDRDPDKYADAAQKVVDKSAKEE